MRLKITLTLLIILLGLLVYIFYIDPWKANPDGPAESTNVLGERAADMDHLSISRNGERNAITLDLENNRWMLKNPYIWPANTYAVERIINQLQFLDAEVSFETGLISQAGSTLAEYGLAPPDLTLDFGRGDRRYTLGVGKATAVGNRLYILSVEGDRIHVVDRSLLDSLSIELEMLRDKNVFEIGIYEVESWNLQFGGAGNARTRFNRQDDDWSLETPIRARANATAVNALLHRILAISSSNIRMPANGSELSALGLQNPEYRIAIETGTQREVLEIGIPIDLEQPSARYAKREDRPTIFEVDLEFLDILGNAQTLLRDRDVFSIDTQAATLIKFTRSNGQTFTLQKLENDDWETSLRDEVNGTIASRGDAQAIKETLEWLSAIRAVQERGFVNDAPSAIDLETYGLEVPDLQIAVTSIDPATIGSDAPLAVTETLQIGILNRDDRSERYVKLKERDYVYLIYDDVFDRIGNQPTDFADRQIHRLPESQTIERIEITRLSDGANVFDQRAETDSNAFAALAGTLKSLRADSFENDGYSETIEIAGANESWEYQLSVYTGNETPVFQVNISKLTGGPLLFGGLPKENKLFRFEQNFIDAFQQIIFDRVKREVPANPFPESIPAVEETEPEPAAN